MDSAIVGTLTLTHSQNSKTTVTSLVSSICATHGFVNAGRGGAWCLIHQRRSGVLSYLWIVPAYVSLLNVSKFLIRDLSFLLLSLLSTFLLLEIIEYYYWFTHIDFLYRTYVTIYFENIQTSNIINSKSVFWIKEDVIICNWLHF